MLVTGHWENGIRKSSHLGGSLGGRQQRASKRINCHDKIVFLIKTIVHYIYKRHYYVHDFTPSDGFILYCSYCCGAYKNICVILVPVHPPLRYVSISIACYKLYYDDNHCPLLTNRYELRMVTKKVSLALFTKDLVSTW